MARRPELRRRGTTCISRADQVPSSAASRFISLPRAGYAQPASHLSRRRLTLAGRARYVSLIGAGLVMPMSLVTAARGESRACNRGRVRVLPLHRQPVCDQSGGRAITKFEESSLLNVVLDERAVGNAQRCPIASFDPGPITTASGSAKSRGHQLRAAIPPWGNGSWLFARTTVRVWLGRRATRPYFFA
jgi:hypothetical protein